VSPQTVADQITAWCQGPFHFSLLPGALRLPLERTGTLVIHDVAALTLPQQILFYDWMSAGRGDLQVVSMTTTSLDALVEQGDFLEGLYYRLNVVRLEAKAGKGRR
jgi:DNA-binding NtrC family response regulator